MAVKRFKDTEWGTTIRTYHGTSTAGGHRYKSVAYWKFKDGQWVEIIDPTKVPIEIRKSLKEESKS